MNKKNIYKSVMALMALVLSLGGMTSCSSDSEPFMTATEDDYPRILQPWFGEWEDGEPSTYKSLSRDVDYVDSVTVTPALYTTVEWYLDGEKINEGKNIKTRLLAGEYILKIVATTTKGLSTSRTGKLIVNALATDPKLSDSQVKRWLNPGKTVSIPCQNLDAAKAVKINGVEATNVKVDNGNLVFTVPDVADGSYNLTVTDGEGTQYGCGKFTVSKEACPYTEETTIWEGDCTINWGDSNVNISSELKNVTPGTKICVYYEMIDAEYHAMRITTPWWGDTAADNIVAQFDVTAATPNPYEFEYTEADKSIVDERGGMLIVGFGYKLTKVTTKSE